MANFTNEEVYEAYMEECGYLPFYDMDILDEFMSQDWIQDITDINVIVDYLRDYIGSQQLYEEGSEEMW